MQLAHWIPLLLATTIIFAGCLSSSPQFSYVNGLASYNLQSPQIISENKTFSPIDNAPVTKIFFQGRQAIVPALLRQPAAGKANGVGIVLLPGAEVKKEPQDASVGKLLVSQGFTVMTLDQRGTGESNFSRDQQADIDQFNAGNETTQSLMVADALQAAALLRQRGLNKIVFVGESLGGRVAIMAAATSGSPVVGISTSGLDGDYPAQYQAYVRSINPSEYAHLLKARAAILHGTKDDMIPMNAAIALYMKINSEKRFAQTPCAHGYCNGASGLVIDAAQWASGLKN